MMERVAARITATRTRAEACRAAAEQSAQRIGALQQRLHADWKSGRVPTEAVFVEKSGISKMLTLAERWRADELRRWLKIQRCQVGPVFESDAGRFSFFVYSKRHAIGDLIAKHGGGVGRGKELFAVDENPRKPTVSDQPPSVPARNGLNWIRLLPVGLLLWALIIGLVWQVVAWLR
jgi:hypothetical protein